MRTTLRVQRSANESDQFPTYSDYAVEFDAGAKVLDALRYIQDSIDPSLGFRWECRCGICGTCAVLVDGVPRLTCEAILEPDTLVTIEPLPGFAVVKDLIVDTSPSIQRLLQLKPYLVPPTSSSDITKEQAEQSKQFRRCIECFACVAAVHRERKSPDEPTIDPLGIVKLARFLTDPRDQVDRQTIAREHDIDLYTMKDMRRATRVCPKHINIVSAYKLLTDHQEGQEK